MEMEGKTAIIIGAGPAGLTAAYELLDKTDIKPIVFEMNENVGGISKTVDFKGNRIDVGGHRFFSKSDRVMQWWTNILPLQGAPSKDDIAHGRDIEFPVKSTRREVGAAHAHDVTSPDPEKTDKVMLIRKRLSRIFFKRKFFDYPIKLNLETFRKMGLASTVRSASSYIRVRLFPIREVRSLEDFFINRFGRELYQVFFKDYTEKLWGVPCSEISPEWGAQRIKGLSMGKTVYHALKSLFFKDTSMAQKSTEASLVEKFMYPKYGPSQMWEEVARLVEEQGGEIHLLHKATGFAHRDGRITEVIVRDESDKSTAIIKGDYFLSTMPIKDLIAAIGDGVPHGVASIAQGLVYRDFVTVSLLLKNLHMGEVTGKSAEICMVPDTWIYVQEKDVLASRMQIYNNWSPYLVKDEGNIWVGLEYMCNEGDNLWARSDDEFLSLAVSELKKIDAIVEEDVLDGVVIRMPKAYPAYFGTYDRLQVIREYTNRFENLYLIGRNGMHRYNNQDHSMLTAMVAVENIVNNLETKDNIWSVNVEEEYLEIK
jgi:protoporphyrinogen oxidase